MGKRRKKKVGHYCWGCDSYKSNESFSGKGHAIHLCKKCKSNGVTRRPERNDDFYKPQVKPNRYMKALKIKYNLIIEDEHYIVFSRGGTFYIAYSNPFDSNYWVYMFNLKSEENFQSTNEFDDIDAQYAINYKSAQADMRYVENWEELSEIEPFYKRYVIKLEEWFANEEIITADDWNDAAVDHDPFDEDDLYLTDFRELYLNVSDKEKKLLSSLLQLQQILSTRIEESEEEEIEFI
ncbi:hypothetical protein HPT25_27730 [Bacillus sp. BRMEA1]|uniref:hypothetical protein n=1 Tax=Neobacillus endophyticus TaxID=2738405 RepID=UPI0015654CAF|nr:hypothetical protein [Neobacillus endophyticus]NRD81087.1 hypothetical protein [Neobacillus endophyticus]